MNKNLKIVLWVITLVLSSVFIHTLNKGVTKLQDSSPCCCMDETISVYTPKNIYYLKGKTITDENGSLGNGVTYESRNIAVAVLEEWTADDSQPESQ